MTAHSIRMAACAAVAAAIWTLSASGFATGTAHASEWSGFRGPAGNGFVGDLSHPTSWDSNSNLAWTVEISGGGWSSPVVVRDRAILTTAVAAGTSQARGFGEGVAAMRNLRGAKPSKEPVSFEVICLDLSQGTQLWRRVVESKPAPHAIHPSNTYATESPATDGNRVFVYFAAIGAVACFDLDGQQIWKRDVGAYPTSNNFGTGSSLTHHAGRLYVQCDNQESSFLTALDVETGEPIWRVDRRSRTCWSTPIVWKNHERTELVVCGSGYVTAYDPETGGELWELSGVGGSFSASPASDLDRIYFGNSGPGSRGPLVAVSAGASGKLTLDSAEGVVWVQNGAGPGMASPVAHDGRLYVAGRGIMSCHNAETGERIYRKRLQGASSIAASLWIADDKLFVLDEGGNTFVIKTGDEFEVLEKNTIDGLYWSTPSVASNTLLLREATKLHCVREAESTKTILD